LPRLEDEIVHNDHVDAGLVAALQRSSRVLSGGVVALGLLVLVGWTFDIQVLKSPPPSLESMKANTAFSFVLLGIALWSSRTGRGQPWRSASASVVLLIAALTVLEYVTGRGLGIDEVLFRDHLVDRAPGRMAPVSALNFMLFGAALLLADLGRRRAGDFAVMLAGGISFLSVCGYLFGAPALHSAGAEVSVAFHTAIGFVCCSLAFLTARPTESVTKILAANTVAGTVLRRTLPFVALVPLSLGWSALEGERLGLYDAAFGTAIVIAASSGLLGAGLVIVGASLHRSELSRKNAEATIALSEQRLRQLVEGSPYAVAMFDREVHYLFASERWLCDYRLNLSQEQIRGRSHYDLFPEIPEHWKVINERCLAGESLKLDAETFVRGDNVVAWVRREVKPWRKDGGEVGGIVIFSEDITERKHAEEQLKRATEQFRLALEAAPAGMLMVDDAGKIVLVNAQTEQLFGYSRAELLGNSVELLVPERMREPHAPLRGGFCKTPSSRPMGGGRDLYGRRKDGSEVPLEIALNPLQTPDGTFVLSSVVDISERVELERQRAELLVQQMAAERQAERSRFFELSLDLVCVANTSGRFVQLNPAFSSVLGYSLDELLATPFIDFVHPDDVVATQRELEKLASGGRTLDFTNRYCCKDGSYRWLQWRSIPDADRTLYAIARDVTDTRELLESLQNKQSALTASLKERDVLLSEVHHRVKNNLQIVASLINLQVRQVGAASRGALEECRSRVLAMALIHEKLYQSKSYSSVPFSTYARSLAQNVFHATDLSPSAVQLDLNIEELSLPVDQAIPCGLILNELITNASKHAFPGGRSGVVRIELGKTSDHIVRLSVADDGVGLPANFELERSGSLGMRLVTTLVQQLNGHLDIDPSRGAAFTVTFAAEVLP
jgi:PAS domain S-box-containing protein